MAHRSPHDTDPKRADVPTQSRKPRARAKAEAPEDLKAQKGKLLKAALKRPHAPAVMFEPDGEGDVVIASPYSDGNLFDLALANTLATRSPAVVRLLTSEIGDLCRLDYDAEAQCIKPNETDMSAALAIVADAQPRTISEAMLVVQSIALHFITMRLSKQALNSAALVNATDAALASKVAGRYASHMETLATMRGRRRTSRQSITVNKTLRQEVHYHHNTPGESEIESQSHGRRESPADERPALPSPDPSGRVVPMPSRARPRPV